MGVSDSSGMGNENESFIKRGQRIISSRHQAADVRKTAWYAGSVNTAYEYGIINGYEGGLFKPQDKITRKQAMVMVSRAMSITGLKTAEEIIASGFGNALAAYADADKISPYAKSGIAACIESNVVTGKGADRIAPKENITRAEVAVIVTRLLQKSDLI